MKTEKIKIKIKRKKQNKTRLLIINKKFLRQYDIPLNMKNINNNLNKTLIFMVTIEIC